MIYQFEQFELDTARFELREDGAVQPLEPQVFALLTYLIEHRERLVPKNEILEELWGGRIVTDSALTSRIKSVRKVLGDSGKAQQFIKTIHSRGFRFVAHVRAAHSTNMGLAEARSCDALDVGLQHELTAVLARLRSLLSSDNVDAWSAFNLGLQHMYRFNRDDDAAAAELFEISKHVAATRKDAWVRQL